MDIGIAEHILAWIGGLGLWFGLSLALCCWSMTWSRVIVESEYYAQGMATFVCLPLLLAVVGGLVALGLGDALDWRWCAWLDG